MTPNEIRPILDRLTDELIERSPFFQFWASSSLDAATAKKFLLSFDPLVKSFPSLIAAGASRMEDETARTVLAVNLYQECGEGDITRSHHAIYRKFLSTAGIDTTSLRESPFAEQWRTRLLDYLQQAETGSVLGALAAGEFLAQPALGRLYPALKGFYPGADQEYFTKHLELETEHVEEITGIILRHAEANGGAESILAGFRFGLSVWETYFEHLSYHLAGTPPPFILRH